MKYAFFIIFKKVHSRNTFKKSIINSSKSNMQLSEKCARNATFNNENFTVRIDRFGTDS